MGYEEDKGSGILLQTEHIHVVFSISRVGREKAVGRFTLYVGET